MKRRWPFVLPFCAALGLLLGMASVGCNPPTTTPPPAAIAPGYLNSADQTMGQVLSGARNFYVSIQCSTMGQGTTTPVVGVPLACDPTKQVTPLVLAQTVKDAFNDFHTALNTADAVYLAYHGGSATEAQAQAAVNTVQTKQAALPLPGAK